MRLYILGNGVDWCEKSLAGITEYENVQLFNERLLVKGKIKRALLKIHYSKSLNRYINIPFKFIWYKEFIERLSVKNDMQKKCLLIYDHHPLGGDFDFLSYLRKEIPGIKLVYIFTNIVKYSAASAANYVEQLSQNYDVIYAFDPSDAKKYGFDYSTLIYDADSDYDSSVESDEARVFYVGQAKDRLEWLLNSFSRLKQLGIEREFHIANVENEKMRFTNEISYNKFISYETAVEGIKKSTCILDAIQGESEGLTIKVCEAVCYNKKLITTNENIVKYSFYDPRYIKIVKNVEDIDTTFFIENKSVAYNHTGKELFSFVHFFNRLENKLEETGWK